MSKECCGTCVNNSYEDGEYICECEVSDAYGLPTAYDDSCDEWGSRGQGRLN